MTENEAINVLNMIEAHGALAVEAKEMAIKALEEVQHWHTSVINPKIKNVFANSSTQICQNCDHKDEYIEELEAEIEQYRAIGTLEELKAAMKYVYLAKKHGTVGQVIENCVKYEEIGTVEECRAAVEKQKAKKIEIFNGQASCPNCKCLFGGMDVIKSLLAWHMPHCKDCGQHLDWSDTKWAKRNIWKMERIILRNDVKDRLVMDVWLTIIV